MCCELYVFIGNKNYFNFVHSALAQVLWKFASSLQLPRFSPMVLSDMLQQFPYKTDLVMGYNEEKCVYDANDPSHLINKEWLIVLWTFIEEFAFRSGGGVY